MTQLPDRINPTFYKPDIEAHYFMCLQDFVIRLPWKMHFLTLAGQAGIYL